MPNPTTATSATQLASQADNRLIPTHTTRVPNRRELVVPLAAGDQAALGALRHLAHSALTTWGISPEQAEDVVVVLSELATNALVHTDGATGIRLHAYPDQLILDVADTSTVAPDFVTGPDGDAEQPHGFGLALIATSLADTLTFTLEPGHGKTVTATFTIKDADPARIG